MVGKWISGLFLLIQDDGAADIYQGLDEAPRHVEAAPRLLSDMQNLQELL